MNAQTPPGSQNCNWCGSINLISEETCKRCGAVLTESHAPSDSDLYISDDAGSATVGHDKDNEEISADAQTPLPMKNEAMPVSKKCNWCGTENSATDKACNQCGAVLPESHIPSGSSAHKPDAVPDTANVDRNIGEIISSLNLVKPFASGHLRAQLAISLLSICILLDVIAIVSGYSQISLLSRMAEGGRVTEAEIAANDVRELIIALSQLMALVVTGIVFLIWIHRAHRNLPALGAINLKYSPGWAVGGFFVPFLNLIRPYQVTTEIWKASSLEAEIKDGESWKYRPSSPVIALWWGVWITSGFLNQSAFRTFLGANSLDSLMAISRVSVLSDAASGFAAALAIVVIRQIDRLQEEKIMWLKASSADRDLNAMGL